MRNLEDNVREAVLDLAHDAPAPHDLAAIARTRGRRIRRKRRAAFAAVAVALAGVTAAPYALLHREAPAPSAPAATTSPSTEPNRNLPAFSADSPYQLPGGAVITAMTGPPGKIIKKRTTHLLYDRADGRYRSWTRENSTVVPAPTGQLFAVYGGVDDESVWVINAKGEVKRRYFAVPYAAPQWSPDGTRLLIPYASGYLISDPTRADPLREGTVPGCPELYLCYFSWLPNGKEFAVARRDPPEAGTEGAVGSVDTYAAETGARTRTLRVTGAPLGTGAWSSDLRSVLVDRATGGIDLFDVASGSRTRLSGADGSFLPDGRILTVDDNVIKLFGPTGQLLQRAQPPAEFRDMRLSAGLP